MKAITKTQLTYPDSSIVDYTYDNGNYLTMSEAKDGYTYNQANQLTQSLRAEGEATSYQYDKNGNLIKKTETDDDGETQTTTYTYDYENRLIKAIKQEQDETETVTFKYDPFGRRIEKKTEEAEDGETETKTYTYLYDNEDIILEYLTKTEDSETKTETAKYIHGPGIDEPLSIERKGEIYYYHADGLGSITALTDKKQKVVESYTYTSFGEVKRKGDKVKNTYTFTGREWDKETGLYYYRARYYDAKTGRFIIFDPILHPANGSPSAKIAACDNSSFNPTFDSFLDTPIKLNPFIYAEDNPINHTDPYGFFSFNKWACCMYKEVKAYGGGASVQLAGCAISCGGICGAASIVSGGALFVPCFGACLEGMCGQLLRYKIQYIVPALTGAAIDCAWKANDPKYCCE